ncbi:MAG: PQQ-binding-like beta-propeller repeat protein [Thermoguttaceae bacterium]|jgi:outer membrane protein assembly factor BamB|nr:PQQ-binding-like beta-propeller repeat protein [Thermoguttaceae bacterium]
MIRSALGCLAISFASALVWAGETWPEFRGPTGDGHAACRGLPVTWSETENVAWKTAIPGHGWSSPVIWHQQIWLTTATPDGREMSAVCVDRETGKIVHEVKVFDTPNPEPIAVTNSYASPTPAVEDGRVYLHYGTYGTACLDTATGRTLWTRRDLNCDHHEGPGSSPILFDNLLIVHVDGRDVQYVVALDKLTGRTAWKTNRSVDYSQYHHNLHKAFCTPQVIQSGERLQLISPGPMAMMGYDPRTGEELWKVRYRGWSMVARPLFGHGLVFMINDYDRPQLWAVRPDGHGDVTDSHVAWTIDRGMPSQPSFLLIGDLLYLVNNGGIAYAVEARTGAEVWRSRIHGDYSASPVYADGKIYFFARDSVATVIEPGRQFEELAVNHLDGEQLMASPAVAGSALFVRTQAHLYRIEAKNPPPGP